MILLVYLCEECGHKVTALFSGESIPDPVNNELAHQARQHRETHHRTPPPAVTSTKPR